MQKFLKKPLHFLIVSGITAVIVSFTPANLAAQDFLPFQLGIKGGVPITSTFSTQSNSTTQYGSANRRWLVGPTAEFKLFGPLSFEVDA